MPINGEYDVTLTQSCLIVGAFWENDAYSRTPATCGDIGRGYGFVVHFCTVALRVRKKADIATETIDDDSSIVEQRSTDTARALCRHGIDI